MRSARRRVAVTGAGIGVVIVSLAMLLARASPHLQRLCAIYGNPDKHADTYGNANEHADTDPNACEAVLVLL